MSYKILSDADLDAGRDMSKAIVAIERAMAARANNQLVAPPRHSVTFGERALTFTIGGVLDADSVAGFRVYDSAAGKSSNAEQIVAVFDTARGAFKGLVIGTEIGAIRTAAIGGARQR